MGRGLWDYSCDCSNQPHLFIKGVLWKFSKRYCGGGGGVVTDQLHCRSNLSCVGLSWAVTTKWTLFCGTPCTLYLIFRLHALDFLQLWWCCALFWALLDRGKRMASFDICKDCTTKFDFQAQFLCKKNKWKRMSSSGLFWLYWWNSHWRYIYFLFYFIYFLLKKNVFYF